MNNALLPTLSTVNIETNVEMVLTRPVMTVDIREALSPKPIVLNNTGA
ncbi:hypothetical protein Leryth_003237 [Lithospermum erythrorhizon]|nr:hypothetical protein Leryth_003237 [Lithospermum erythrorhizon]